MLTLLPSQHKPIMSRQVERLVILKGQDKKSAKVKFVMIQEKKTQFFFQMIPISLLTTVSIMFYCT